MYAANLFIDGAHIDKTGAERIEVVNPATEETLGSVPSSTAAEVTAALAAAERGFEVWRNTLPWERCNVLRKIAGLLRERQEMIARLLTMEIGKPLSEARAEVAVSAEYFDYCADEARRLHGYMLDGRTPGARFEVSHGPVGVVLALAAWNFPISLASRKLAMALAAGCTVILRPAEEAPACVAELVRCCHDGGLPNGAVNLLFGSPQQVVVPLMAAPAVRKLSFTGSTRVGQTLMRQAADTVKRMTMELGGHAPFIVLGDADVEKAATAAVGGKYRNAGQVCTSPSRFFVHEKIADTFTEKMAAKAQALRLGNGLDDGVLMGPLATARQRDRAERLVEDALGKGATLATGGKRPASLNRGYFFEPTVLADLPPDASILADEPFAPVAAIVRCASADEAIARANAVEFGLAGYLFASSKRAIDHVTRELQVGVLGVNTTVVAVPEAPFGGIKQSGFGREGGAEGVREYLNTKFVHNAPA
ncbi:NAD-dependent succinate-semialdehyde dehydrogenase [Bosea sp. NBC_00550]|uniref:NAD-dependent succinate-semialdehyde dehydrogenase n=1 Tax=Bosea sp. NBC_00550 TaxID=2969621 RepID=UPI0022319D4E|nr:NAD-dependent succinate-semialdehyde dehydrogenase [Bosea sp. NBC_00550]UZF95883.1 NAD-dependent succinate-semialdehyde dehydrogenase [Bosea sp. NBC_00550]